MPSASSNAPVALPLLIAAFVDATNSFDLEGLMVTVADDIACQRSTGAKRPSGAAQNGTSSAKTDDRSYARREALRQLYRYRRYRRKF